MENRDWVGSVISPTATAIYGAVYLMGNQCSVMTVISSKMEFFYNSNK